MLLYPDTMKTHLAFCGGFPSFFICQHKIALSDPPFTVGCCAMDENHAVCLQHDQDTNHLTCI